MTYTSLWHRLTGIYPVTEAQAVVRMLLEELAGLSLADIYAGGIDRLNDAQRQQIERGMARLEANTVCAGTRQLLWPQLRSGSGSAHSASRNRGTVPVDY